MSRQFYEFCKVALFKRAFEGWGMGGEWSTYQGDHEADGSPLLHERGVPYDVEAKTDRQEFFRDKQRGLTDETGQSPREPHTGGKIIPGRIGKYHGTGR